MLAATVAVAAGPDYPASDERVVLFPTAAWLDEEAGEWVVPLHGWIFEPEEDSFRRGALMRGLRQSLGLGDESGDLLEKQAWPFLVDNERGERVGLRIAGREVVADPSGTEGHFRAAARVPAKEAGAPAGSRLGVRVVMAPGDERRFEGEVQLVGPRGVSVVSDIDDTVRDTGVGDPERVLRTTFLEPLAPMPGMAPVYARLAERGAAFHYVSTSPWQLYGALSEMMDGAGFPRGSMHLKEFRWADSRFLDLFEGADRLKPGVLDILMERYPGRRFLLIGDDADMDPEIYAAAAKRHPGQVLAIAIRRTGAGADLGGVFKGLEGVPWIEFEDPAELREFGPVRKLMEVE